MLDQLKLLDGNESVVAVFSNKLPNACPMIDFRIRQEMFDGGSYTDTCLLKVPANHADAAYVTNGYYLLFQDDDGYWQEYRIADVVRVDDMEGSYIEATGEHAFYELLGEPLDDIRPTSTTATAAVIQALSGTRWTVGTGDDLGSNSTRIYKTNVLTGLAQIASVWGGELRFYLDVVGGVITGRRVDILTQRGNVTGKRFEFRKDLVNITYTRNTQNLATALIGRGKGEEVDGGADSTDPAYGRRIEFTDVVWTTAGGDPADKPADQNWIGDDTAKAAYGPAGRHVYGYVIFEDCTDEEELLTLTYNELQVRKAPQETWDMSVILLETISGLEHEAIRLGDTTDVINNAAAVVVTGQARVIKLDKSLIMPESGFVTLGSYIPTLSGSKNSLESQTNNLYSRAGVWDRSGAITSDPTGGGALEYKIDLLKTQLSSITSGIYTDVNGNLIIENGTQTAAVKIGGGIIALANAKTSGEYDWRTFADGDGYTADEMTTGTLNAAIVFAGTLLAASGTFTDLVAGVVGAQRIHEGFDALGFPFFKMYDDDNNLVLSIVNGELGFGSDIVVSRVTLGNLVMLGTFID
jgi:phage minor structural protein